MSMSVCLSVCLSVHEDIPGKEPHAIFTNFGHVAYVRGSLLLRHVPSPLPAYRREGVTGVHSGGEV